MSTILLASVVQDPLFIVCGIIICAAILISKTGDIKKF